MYSLPEKTVYVKRLLIHFSFSKFSCGLCVVDIWLLVVNAYSSSRLDVTGFGLPLELSGISDLLKCCMGHWVGHVRLRPCTTAILDAFI